MIRLRKAERFRVDMSVIIAALVLIGTLSSKYPLVFLVFLILGLIYSVYRIIKDRKKASSTVVADKDMLQ